MTYRYGPWDPSLYRFVPRHCPTHTPRVTGAFRLAALEPQPLVLMHGHNFVGDAAAELNALTDYFDNRLVTT